MRILVLADGTRAPRSRSVGRCRSVRVAHRQRMRLVAGEGGASPRSTSTAFRSILNGMSKTSFISSNARRHARNAPNTEMALFLAILAIGLSLLSLFAVIAFASFVELAHLLSLFALPLVLLVASALFLRRWAAGEGADKGIQEPARYSSNRRDRDSGSDPGRLDRRPRGSGLPARRPRWSKRRLPRRRRAGIARGDSPLRR